MKALVLIFVSTFLLISFPSLSQTSSGEREWYELRTYHFADSTQGRIINRYLQEALVPALHRAGRDRIGVFTSWANDTVADKRIFLFFPVKSFHTLGDLPAVLGSDLQYQLAALDFDRPVDGKFPYSRMEKVFLKAFAFMPRAKKPALAAPVTERVYELRSYESATETLARNKIKMFNEGGEIALFERLGFNAVFYAEVVSGSRMPNLMYMTSFENRSERDAHWKSFGADPEWKQLSARPEYKGNVSHIDIFFLRPTAYSDL